MSLSPTLAHYSSFLQPPPHPLFLHSFPTRRSSDLSSWLQRLPRTIPASRRVPSLLRKAPRSAETRRTRSPDAYFAVLPLSTSVCRLTARSSSSARNARHERQEPANGHSSSADGFVESGCEVVSAWTFSTVRRMLLLDGRMPR